MKREALLFLLLWSLVVMALTGCASFPLPPMDPRDYAPGGAMNHVYSDWQRDRCCGCRR